MKKNIIDLLSRLWFPILVLLCCLILSIRFATGQDIELKDAKRLVEVDQQKKAISLLNAAIEKYPLNAQVWFHHGMVHLKNKNVDVATKSFDKGIQLDEKEPLNYIGRGSISLAENNIQKAEIDFTRAQSPSKGKNTSVLKVLGEAYLQHAKLHEKALEVLLKAKAIDNHDPETFLLLGDAYLAQNNGGLAVTSYENAAMLDSKSARPHYKIGLVYLRSRNFPGAQEAFVKAIQIDPAYTLAYKELGELYYQMKDGPKAVKAYESYLSLTDQPDEGKVRYAFFLFMAKDFAKANSIFSALIDKGSTTPTMLRFYAFSLYEAGDLQQSRKIFEQYFTSAATEEIEASDYAYYGKLLLKQNQDSTAIVAFGRSLSLDGNQPELLQLQAESYFKIKKYAQAIESYEKLMSIRSKPLSQDLYTLGRAYYFNQEYDKAEVTFQKLVELQPNMTVGYLWTARTKSNLDPESEKGLAKPFYETLIEKALPTPEKNKNDLMEAYSYLGYYHFLKQEAAISKSYWNKLLELNPNDTRAKEALKAFQ
ncbi:tetratricopeptide repeat protein [Chryseolinea sp. H1M3-3]|uniref:tetratricopeptide repeat protein n=1 Tax=Chryseolinea sp. H1M3-3 TaxID=3034144 RepID=UPI0023EBEF24|nr:tetratricopeptide repeat protein [Chryseolinea sp. H1M3-3]